MEDKNYKAKKYIVMKTNQKIVSVFLVSLSFLLMGAYGSLKAQTSITANVNKGVLLTGKGDQNSRNFVWNTNGGTIIYGEGTNQVLVAFPAAGNKSVKLSYLDQNGQTKNETYAIMVYDKPTFTLSVGAFCSGSKFNAPDPRVKGTYTEGSGQWWLDNNLLSKGDVLTLFDNGKFLQYSVETPCGRIYSDGIKIVVNDHPSVTGISGLSTPISVGSSLYASVDISPNGNLNDVTYKWLLGRDSIANTKEISYNVKLGDGGKPISIIVGNGCGNDTISHALKSETVELNSNQALPLTVAVPANFMTRGFNLATDSRPLPDKYWENTNYRFYTSNKNYVEGQTMWFDYVTKGNSSGWVISTSGVGYEFKIVRAPSNLDNLPRQNNTTILLDNIDRYEITVNSDPDSPFELFSNTNGFAQKCKIFGLKNLKYGILDESKKVVISVNSPVTSDLPTGLRVQSVTDCVLENIKFDGNNRIYYNYFLDVIDGEDGHQNNQHLILKDIAIYNVKNKVNGTNPRSVVVFIAHNRRDTPSGYIKDQRYIYNLEIDASCIGVPGSGTATNAAVYVYGSENLYFDRIFISTLPGCGIDAPFIISSGTGGTPLSDSHNIIVKELDHQFDKITIERSYKHSGIVLPTEDRYYLFTPGNDGLNIYKNKPSFSPNGILYDRQTGYYLVPSTMATSNLAALRDVYQNYSLDANGLAITDNCPSPNIMLLADSSSQEVEGFTVPDFGIGKVQVNIVAVNPDVSELKSTSDLNDAKKWSYDSETPVVFTSCSQKNSVYNINFATEGGYFIEKPCENSLYGNFYNCTFKSLTESTDDDDRLVLKTTTALDNINQSGIEITSGNGTLEVRSTSGAIQKIDCYDVQGRLIVTQKGIASDVCMLTIPSGNRVVLVKVQTDNGSVTKKVLN